MDSNTPSLETHSTVSNWMTYIKTNPVPSFIVFCILLFILYLAYKQHKKNKHRDNN